MATVDRVRRFVTGQQRALTTVPWQGLGGGYDQLLYGGNQYLLSGRTTYGAAEPFYPAGECQALTSNGVVYGIVRTRVDLFAQVRFVWKRYGAGPRPMASDTFTSSALSPLDNPAPILEWMELDVAAAGASYWVLDTGRLRRLPPTWCTIVSGSNVWPDDPGQAWDAEPVGLIVLAPGAPADRAETFLWSEVAAYIPERDPDARWRGMSYLRPALEDVAADNGARRYLTKFYENNASPNMAVVFPPDVQLEVIQAFRDAFLQKHAGVERAFRTAFLGGGADLKMIGSNLKDLDSQEVRSQLHKDITLSAGVPPIAAGIWEGTYANAKESNRALADKKLRYLWLRAVEAFRPLFPAPSGAELWYDASGVSALQSDAIDDATVMAQNAQTMRTLGDGGWDPDSVRDGVSKGDLSGIKHTGNLSVQLTPAGQAPGTGGATSG